MPRFTFPPTDLSSSAKLQEACYKLWQSGVVSTQTMLELHGYDMKQEAGRVKREGQEGVLRPQPGEQEGAAQTTQPAGQTGKVGRPEVDDDQRTSDKSKAYTGKAPKPSNPEGSL